ncbi:MAG: hypothetical protein WCO56_25515 [Verrucomicrobiota bacterium]
MQTKSSSTTTVFISRKTLIIAGICLLALSGVGGWYYHVSHPPQPWLVKWQVMRYLKQNARINDFSVNFPYPSRAEMAKPATGSNKDSTLTKGPRTGKDFETLSREYLQLKTTMVLMEREITESVAQLKLTKARLEQLTKQLEATRTGNETNGAATNTPAIDQFLSKLQDRITSLEKKAAAKTDLDQKESQLAPITADLWEFQRVWNREGLVGGGGTNALTDASTRLMADIRNKLGMATTYGTMYTLIGQQLQVAEYLLDSGNPIHRRLGLQLALEAAYYAQNETLNDWLAARICEGYLHPNADIATDPSRRSPFNPDNFLNTCVNFFWQNNETHNVIRVFELMLAGAPTVPRADYARSQLGMALEQAGEYEKALTYLKQIQATNDYRRIIRRIPSLERTVASR